MIGNPGLHGRRGARRFGPAEVVEREPPPNRRPVLFCFRLNALISRNPRLSWGRRDSGAPQSGTVIGIASPCADLRRPRDHAIAVPSRCFLCELPRSFGFDHGHGRSGLFLAPLPMPRGRCEQYISANSQISTRLRIDRVSRHDCSLYGLAFSLLFALGYCRPVNEPRALTKRCLKSPPDAGIERWWSESAASCDTPCAYRQAGPRAPAASPAGSE